jgi:hypothetical protein
MAQLFSGWLIVFPPIFPTEHERYVVANPSYFGNETSRRIKHPSHLNAVGRSVDGFGL